MTQRQSQCSVTDAKSLYDCFLRERPSGKQGRKSSLDLAIMVKDLQGAKSTIKWVPRQKMLVRCLTKNGALTQFLKSAWFSFADVKEELELRRNHAAYRRRSLKASSDRLRKEYQQDFRLFCEKVLSTLMGGNCEISVVGA